MWLKQLREGGRGGGGGGEREIRERAAKNEATHTSFKRCGHAPRVCNGVEYFRGVEPLAARGAAHHNVFHQCVHILGACAGHRTTHKQQRNNNSNSQNTKGCSRCVRATRPWRPTHSCTMYHRCVAHQRAEGWHNSTHTQTHLCHTQSHRLEFLGGGQLSALVLYGGWEPCLSGQGYTRVCVWRREARRHIIPHHTFVRELLAGR